MKKEIMKQLKKLTKKTGFKILQARMCMYLRMEGYLFDCSIFYNFNDEKSKKIGCLIFVKPIFIDDLFWTIFKSEELISEPDSYRVIGVITVQPPKLKEIEIDFINIDESTELLFNLINEEIQLFLDKCKDDENYFYNFAWKDDYVHRDLTRLLVLVKNKKYNEAISMSDELISEGYEGSFFDRKDKGIYEYIGDYCYKKLRKRRPIVDKIKKLLIRKGF